MRVSGQGRGRGLGGDRGAGESVKTRGRFIPVSTITCDNLVSLSPGNFHTKNDTGRMGADSGKHKPTP